MIISCINCNKKFDVDPNLIPKEGRLVQCIGCDHKWFFKNPIIPKLIEPFQNENLNIFENIENKNNNSSNVNKKNISKNKIQKKITIQNNKNIKKSNFLSLTIVFLISLIALIIIMDTFKSPIGKIIPNIEFILYNLYETLNDIELFLRDLI